MDDNSVFGLTPSRQWETSAARNATARDPSHIPISPSFLSQDRQQKDDSALVRYYLVHVSISILSETQYEKNTARPNLSPQNSLYGSYLEQKLPGDIILEGITLYFEYLHNQPYPLLMRMSKCCPRSTSELPPSIVWYPMLALSLRTSQHPLAGNRERLAKTVNDLSESAWELLMKAYSRMEVDVHYFQGLCLQAQVDFAGKYQ